MSRSTSANSGPTSAPAAGGSSSASTQSLVNPTIMIATVTGTLTEQQNLCPSPLRPSCNSILHLFGLWLFEASFIGTDLSRGGGSPRGNRNCADFQNQVGGSRPSSLSAGSSSLTAESVDLPP